MATTGMQKESGVKSILKNHLQQQPKHAEDPSFYKEYIECSSRYEVPMKEDSD